MPLALVALASLFLSTPSARRATKRQWPRPTAKTISIHALREEGDALHREGEVAARGFLSTPSARRATCSIVTLWGTI